MSDASSASSSEGPSPAATPAVHLGFSEPIERSEDVETIAHNSPIWSDWDGGKIGGRPSWLNPRDVPVGPLRCRACAKRNALTSKSENTTGNGDESADQKAASETRDVNAQDTRTTSTRTATDSATVMRFLCQTYCPADADSNPPNEAAFHRTIYVFACPSVECSTNPTPDSVLVLRGQLPKENDFYPAITKDRENDFDSWEKNKSTSWDVNLCEVCGCKAGGRCPKQNLWFCCREHQKEHLKYCRTKNGSSNEEADRKVEPLPSLYAESELVVEDEPSVKKTTIDDEERLRQEMDRVAMFSTSANDEKKKDSAASANAHKEEEEEELDENLEQADLNDMTGAAGTGTSDVAMLEFYSRIGRGDGGVKDQCLRYCRWHEADGQYDDKNAVGLDANADVADSSGGGGPLWISSYDTPSKDDISPCQHCGAPRKFELQIMPQMLSFLFGDRSQDKTRDSAASEEVRAALLAASNIAEQAKMEGREGELPSDFKKRHDSAVQEVRNALLIGGSGAKQGGDGVDWGVIAVYTCTASCGDGIIDYGKKMEAYREEFAWRQQPLGV